MNELAFAAQRAALSRTDAPVDQTEARFRGLVQSPLRAGLVRFLNARPDESFDIESLMATFGRMRLDVENCLKELVDFGLARRLLDASSCRSPHRPPAGACAPCALSAAGAEARPSRNHAA